MKSFSFAIISSILFCLFSCTSEKPQEAIHEKITIEEKFKASEYEINVALRSMKDFAFLARYQSDNQELTTSNQSDNRVVFMGNSIVEGWVKADSTFFQQNNYIGRGISGQTSQQMLLRFRKDVIDLQPQIVVINAGTNDIAENTGPYDASFTFGNIISMAQLAQANGITPVLSAVLPADAFPWRKDLGDPSPKVLALNAQLKAYAANNNLVFLDYHTSLKNKTNGMNEDLAADGIHPTLKGYKVMEGLAKEAIRITNNE